MTIVVEVSNLEDVNGVVDVYVQDPTGQRNGFLESSILPGMSATYTVHGTQSLLVSESNRKVEDFESDDEDGLEDLDEPEVVVPAPAPVSPVAPAVE